MRPPGTAGELAELLDLRAEKLYGVAGSRLYDRLSREDPQELAEFLAIVDGVGSPVLELACGSGRLTLPLARRGHQVVALDSAPEMHRLLATRLQADRAEVRARVRPVEGDMRSFRFEQRFDAIVLPTSSVCLLDFEGRAALFEAVGNHLTRGGVFVVSTMDFPESCAADCLATEVAASGLRVLDVRRVRGRSEEHGSATVLICGM